VQFDLRPTVFTCHWQKVAIGGALIKERIRGESTEELLVGLVESIEGEPIFGEPIEGEPIFGEPITGESRIEGQLIERGGVPIKGEVVVDANVGQAPESMVRGAGSIFNERDPSAAKSFFLWCSTALFILRGCWAFFPRLCLVIGSV